MIEFKLDGVEVLKGEKQTAMAPYWPNPRTSLPLA